ncbi:MAG: hypothetical protein QM813_22790 [Verrucomicrobiota bacterium]
MRTPLPFFALALLLIGCRSPQHTAQSSPRQLATDDAIREHVVGTWQADWQSFPGRAVTYIFRSDGSFTARHVVEGTEHRYDAHWRADRGVLFITPEMGAPISDGDQFVPVWRVDDHELVCRPGISVAGDPLRFTR